MFCVHCGTAGAAAFCASCGKRQNSTACDGGSSHQTAMPTVHWTETIQYQELLDNAVARQRIVAAGRHARQGVTGEDLLKVFDAVSPIGISLGKFTQAILPIYDKLGIKTDRQAQRVLDAPPGRVLLAALCAIAAKGLEIAEVQQDLHKCSLTSEIPSGLIINRGKLQILLEVRDQQVTVSLATRISGQWYDWGKSDRFIAEIFARIDKDLVDQQTGPETSDRRVA